MNLLFNYKIKYLKYKLKYIQLKKKLLLNKNEIDLEGAGKKIYPNTIDNNQNQITTNSNEQLDINNIDLDFNPIPNTNNDLYVSNNSENLINSSEPDDSTMQIKKSIKRKPNEFASNSYDWTKFFRRKKIHGNNQLNCSTKKDIGENYLQDYPEFNTDVKCHLEWIKNILNEKFTLQLSLTTRKKRKGKLIDGQELSISEQVNFINAIIFIHKIYKYLGQEQKLNQLLNIFNLALYDYVPTKSIDSNTKTNDNILYLYMSFYYKNLIELTNDLLEKINNQ